MFSHRVLNLNSRLAARFKLQTLGSFDFARGYPFASRYQHRGYTTEAENASKRFEFTTVHKVVLASIAGFAIGLDLGLYSAAKTPPEVPSLSSAFASSYASPEELQLAIQELRDSLTGPHQVDTSEHVLETYATSENTYHPTSSHAVVVHARSTDDVVEVVNIARKYKVPVITYSGGTSLEAHFSGHPAGSICLDMSEMDRILKINEADADLICEAGARWEDINQTLQDKGIPLFFPLDPGPTATIGGMAATGCSGTNAVRYGTARGEWFLNFTVVLPSGEVIKTRRRARKSSTGFDTTKLFVGSEGTLGIITQATLRLAPRLPTKVAMAQFPDVYHAVGAVQRILTSPYGAHIQCVELVDDQMMEATNKGGVITKPYPVADTLFFKIQGDEEAVRLTWKTVEKIIQEHGSTKFEFAATDSAADEMWSNRKFALMSMLAALPGCRPWPTDVCIPVSRLPQFVYETKEDLKNAGLNNTVIGHVGDGNFHATILVRDEEEMKAAEAANDRIIKRAIALDGTCSGEHGIGLGKKKYLINELGLGTVKLMRSIKKTIDPYNIFNPGKLYPDIPSEVRDSH